MTPPPRRHELQNYLPPVVPLTPSAANPGPTPPFSGEVVESEPPGEPAGQLLLHPPGDAAIHQPHLQAGVAAEDLPDGVEVDAAEPVAVEAQAFQRRREVRLRQEVHDLGSHAVVGEPGTGEVPEVGGAEHGD